MESLSENGLENDVVRKVIEAVFPAPPELQEKALRVLRGELIEQKQDSKPEQFISLKTCGKALGISTTSLWRWNVPGYDLGGRRRFRLSEVNAYLESERFRAHAKRLRKQRSEKIK